MGQMFVFDVDCVQPDQAKILKFIYTWYNIPTGIGIFSAIVYFLFLHLIRNIHYKLSFLELMCQNHFGYQDKGCQILPNYSAKYNIQLNICIITEYM